MNTLKINSKYTLIWHILCPTNYINKKMTITRQLSIKDNLSLLLKNIYSNRELSNPCQNMTKGTNDKRGPLRLPNE